MKIGISIADFTWPSGPTKLGATLGEIARTADQAGFESIWVMDHFWQIGMIGPPEKDMLEGYSALAYMAAVTSRAKLGTMVTGAVYRYPGILAKTVTTLDVLSGDVLREHCKAVGRNDDDIEKTAMFQFDVGDNGGKVDKLIGGLHWLNGMGIQTVIGGVPNIDNLTQLEIIGKKVIPAVANLQPSTVAATR